MRKILLIVVLLLSGCGKHEGDSCVSNNKHGFIGSDEERCMVCADGASPSMTRKDGCNYENNGVYCCSSGVTTIMGCPNPTGCFPPLPWRGGNYCFPTKDYCLSVEKNCEVCY